MDGQVVLVVLLILEAMDAYVCVCVCCFFCVCMGGCIVLDRLCVAEIIILRKSCGC